MADKYAVTKARLDDLSTSVQELTGSATGLTLEQMQEQLDAANAEVAAQAILIDEISNILATKAGGSGGDSAAVETCTFAVQTPDGPIESGMAFCYATGADLTSLKIDLATPASYNVLKNSIISADINMVDWSGTFTPIRNGYAIIIADTSTITFCG